MIKYEQLILALFFKKLHLIGHLNVKQNIELIKNKIDSENVEKLIIELGLQKKSTNGFRIKCW